MSILKQRFKAYNNSESCHTVGFVGTVKLLSKIHCFHLASAEEEYSSFIFSALNSGSMHKESANQEFSITLKLTTGEISNVRYVKLLTPKYSKLESTDST